MQMFEIDKKKFGAFVAELRRERGYTQRELAEKLLISDKAVSKWETAASIPDTALLIPLAELLGVTVTELLMCQRMDAGLDAEQMDTAVRTALAYPEEKPVRAYQVKSRWPFWYGCALIAGGVGAALNMRGRTLAEALIVALVLGTVFGAYFCFFVKVRLPDGYAENHCGIYYDGPFRMNIPGVRIHSGNWPKIVLVCRIWSCLTVALCPLLALGMNALAPALWARIANGVLLVLTLGGMFLPVYLVGKRDS